MEFGSSHHISFGREGVHDPSNERHVVIAIADGKALLDAAISEPRPKLRSTLLDSGDELRAYKEIATLRDAGVGPPADRPTDFAAAAEAAAERGMNRLAERLRAMTG